MAFPYAGKLAQLAKSCEAFSVLKRRFMTMQGRDKSCVSGRMRAGIRLKVWRKRQLDHGDWRQLGRTGYIPMPVQAPWRSDILDLVQGPIHPFPSQSEMH